MEVKEEKYVLLKRAGGTAVAFFSLCEYAVHSVTVCGNCVNSLKGRKESDTTERLN